MQPVALSAQSTFARSASSTWRTTVGDARPSEACCSSAHCLRAIMHFPLTICHAMHGLSSSCSAAGPPPSASIRCSVRHASQHAPGSAIVLYRTARWQLDEVELPHVLLGNS